MKLVLQTLSSEVTAQHLNKVAAPADVDDREPDSSSWRWPICMHWPHAEAERFMVTVRREVCERNSSNKFRFFAGQFERAR